jgi:hypothetical protein
MAEMAKKNPLMIILAKKKKGDMDMGDDGEDDDKSDKTACAQDILDAIKAEDAEKLAEALEDFDSLCEQKMQPSGDEDEDEGQDDEEDDGSGE